MIERLEVTLERYNFLTEELSKPEVLSDVKKMTTLSKEQSSLTEIIEKYTEYKRGLRDIEEAKERLNDKEKTIVVKRFFNGRTQMEVADEIGISQAQVSRLEKSAIDHIKRYYK